MYPDCPLPPIDRRDFNATGEDPFDSWICLPPANTTQLTSWDTSAPNTATWLSDPAWSTGASPTTFWTSTVPSSDNGTAVTSTAGSTALSTAPSGSASSPSSTRSMMTASFTLTLLPATPTTTSSSSEGLVTTATVVVEVTTFTDVTATTTEEPTTTSCTVALTYTPIVAQNPPVPEFCRHEDDCAVIEADCLAAGYQEFLCVADIDIPEKAGNCTCLRPSACPWVTEGSGAVVLY